MSPRLTFLVLIKLLAAEDIVFIRSPKNFTAGIGDTGALVCEIDVNDGASYGKFLFFGDVFFTEIDH